MSPAKTCRAKVIGDGKCHAIQCHVQGLWCSLLEILLWFRVIVLLDLLEAMAHQRGDRNLGNALDALFLLLLAITAIACVQRATEVKVTSDEALRFRSTKFVCTIQEDIDFVRCLSQFCGGAYFLQFSRLICFAVFTWRILADM